MPAEVLETVARSAQVLSVVVGVVVSVLSFNAAREKEAEARKLEAAKPGLELRQNTYKDVVKTVAILVNPDDYTAAELTAAKQRFRALYVAELSMVESGAVESRMFALAKVIDPPLASMTPGQTAAYNLAHALRDSFVSFWGIEEPIAETR